MHRGGFGKVRIRVNGRRGSVRGFRPVSEVRRRSSTFREQQNFLESGQLRTVDKCISVGGTNDKFRQNSGGSSWTKDRRPTWDLRVDHPNFPILAQQLRVEGRLVFEKDSYLKNSMTWRSSIAHSALRTFLKFLDPKLGLHQIIPICRSCSKISSSRYFLSCRSFLTMSSRKQSKRRVQLSIAIQNFFSCAGPMKRCRCQKRRHLR